MRLLCTGDIHIGRRSSKVPSRLRPERFACAAAWDRVVDAAIAEKADVVLISGDITDKDNRFYEAVGPLERGLMRLAEAGIEAYAVAGNHDHDTLAGLARAAGGRLHVLGHAGIWESREIYRDGRPALRLVGWSYPSEHYSTSPLDDLRLPPSDLPTVGILHAEVGSGRGSYAPVTERAFEPHPFALWLLGHVHRPYLRELPGTTLLNPGSPQAMDPGETDAHGAWIVEILPGRRPLARMIPLSLAHYADVAVDLAEATNEDEARQAIVREIRLVRDALAAERGATELLSLRVRLVGRCAVPIAALASIGKALEETDLNLPGLHVQIERVAIDGVRPARVSEDPDGNDPLAVLSRAIHSLEGNAPSADPAAARLVERLRRRVREAYEHPHYVAVAETIPDEAQVRAWALAAAYRLLDELCTQKEVA